MAIEHIIKAIIKREGGYVNHFADRGGPTKYGVTLKALGFWLGRYVTAEDVKALDKKTAFEIYYRVYYQGPNIDKLPKAIQEVMLDMAVNHGPSKAGKILQITLNQNGFVAGLVDGILGPRTIHSAELCFRQIGTRLVNHLVDNRIDFYHDIVRNDPSQQVFLAGWINRANSFLL